MRVRPFLLFGGSHPYPEQIWICLVDSFDYRPVILFRELRLIGWRIGFHFDVREIHRCTPFDQCQHLFAAAHEKTFSSLPIQLVHFKFEQIPAGNAPRRFGFGIQPTTRLHDACPVRDQHIPPLQSFGKEPVLMVLIRSLPSGKTANPWRFSTRNKFVNFNNMNMAVLKYYIIFVAQQRTP